MTRPEDLEYMPIEKAGGQILSVSAEPTSRAMSMADLGNGADSAPRKLENGKWACNHNCRNKTR